MIATSALTVFLLGLRHGADPDHLAAIDNVTRNAYGRKPILSRFVGALFAGGHSVMIVVMAGIAGFVTARFAGSAPVIELMGTCISICILLAMAVLNVRQLFANRTDELTGVRTRLLPRALREASNPLVAIPIGLLFGLGFETSSQVATYSVAFSSNHGLLGGAIVGLTFCVGLVCTDTLDGFLIHRMVSHRANALPQVARLWLWAVTVFAVVVALYQMLQLAGWKPPFSDLALSMVLVGGLGAIFACAFMTFYGRCRGCQATAAKP